MLYLTWFKQYLFRNTIRYIQMYRMNNQDLVGSFKLVKTISFVLRHISCIMISRVDLARYRVSRAKDLVIRGL